MPFTGPGGAGGFGGQHMQPPGMPGFRPPGSGPAPMLGLNSVMQGGQGGGGMGLPGPPGSGLLGAPASGMPANGPGVPLYAAMAPQGAPPVPPPQKKDMLEELLGHKSIRDRQKTEK